MVAPHSRPVSLESPTTGQSGGLCCTSRLRAGRRSHAAATRDRVGRSGPAYARTQGVNQPARTLVGFDPFCRRPTHPDGQQPLGTTLAWAGFGAEELLRLRSPVEWSPGGGALFYLGHAPVGADQSAAVAQLVPAKLRRGRGPGTGRHRTIPALEPVRRHARQPAGGN